MEIRNSVIPGFSKPNRIVGESLVALFVVGLMIGTVASLLPTRTSHTYQGFTTVNVEPVKFK